MSIPRELTRREKEAILDALQRMAPSVHSDDTLRFIERGEGAALRDGRILVWYSQANHEDPLTLWLEPASGDYLLPSEYYNLQDDFAKEPAIGEVERDAY